MPLYRGFCTELACGKLTDDQLTKPAYQHVKDNRLARRDKQFRYPALYYVKGGCQHDVLVSGLSSSASGDWQPPLFTTLIHTNFEIQFKN